MAIYTNSYETFDSNNKREDLANVIYNISPTETPFMSGVAKTKATNKLERRDLCLDGKLQNRFVIERNQ